MEEKLPSPERRVGRIWNSSSTGFIIKACVAFSKSKLMTATRFHIAMRQFAIHWLELWLSILTGQSRIWIPISSVKLVAILKYVILTLKSTWLAPEMNCGSLPSNGAVIMLSYGRGANLRVYRNYRNYGSLISVFPRSLM